MGLSSIDKLLCTAELCHQCINHRSGNTSLRGETNYSLCGKRLYHSVQYLTFTSFTCTVCSYLRNRFLFWLLRQCFKMTDILDIKYMEHCPGVSIEASITISQNTLTEGQPLASSP